MSRKFHNILETIGRTPIVRLNKIAPEGVNLFAKIESFNPMGSVKDRLALGIIEQAEKSVELKPGQTVVEATSGNTGIGLAMVCAQKGYPLVVTMAENFSIERRKMMRFFGARIVLTPAALKGTGMLAKATELAEKHGWFLCRQFENEANADAHSRTTALEILADFAGERLDYWVTGFGTGGTLKGIARVLAKERPETLNDMTAEETEIARSTSGYRFDSPALPAASVETEASAPSFAAEFVNRTVNDPSAPVTLFALEWCEFCWSVRKMLACYEIPYRAIDLDSVEYQSENKGGHIRTALNELTGSKTIPQIFIGGKFVGGATELFDAAKDGTMQELLEQSAVPYNKTVSDDPYSFLPGWLHAR